MSKFKKQDPGDEKNFFCSELVASAYKKLGLLPKNISSGSYLPWHFTDRGKLKLVKGALWPEQVLDFNLI